MERPEKRKLDKNSPYLEYDKGFNHACMLYEEFIKQGANKTKRGAGALSPEADKESTAI